MTRSRFSTLALILALTLALPASAQHEVTGELPKPAGDLRAKPIVVVAGATGRTGRQLIAQLVKDERFALRSLARDAAKAKRELGGEYNWMTADVTRPDSLLTPLRGATYVISAIGATERSGPNGPEFVDYGGVKNLVDAAKRGGVRQLTLISSIGVEGEGGFVRWILNLIGGDVLIWKKKGEQYLRASGLGYTILRPGGLSDDPGGQTGLSLDQDPDAFGEITRSDTAMVAIATLGNTAALGKSFNAIADEDAPRDAWREQLAKLSADR
jgi:uncharacterized protein YbjT (DUF2867 family)